jgi:ADP-heptose:LPS heptosyltransferase
LTALIFIAPLLITNNTGPAHIAAALSAPVVDLYALTNSQQTPWMVPPEAVVKAALDLFASKRMDEE